MSNVIVTLNGVVLADVDSATSDSRNLPDGIEATYLDGHIITFTVLIEGAVIDARNVDNAVILVGDKAVLKAGRGNSITCGDWCTLDIRKDSVVNMGAKCTIDGGKDTTYIAKGDFNVILNRSKKDAHVVHFLSAGDRIKSVLGDFEDVQEEPAPTPVATPSVEAVIDTDLLHSKLAEQLADRMLVTSKL